MADNNLSVYEEGHKRETRKSYQAYIETFKPGTEPSAMKTEPDTSDGMTSDDTSIRRSKRTPIPKRNFKLIDGHENKKDQQQQQQTPPAKKRDRKDRKSPATLQTPKKVAAEEAEEGVGTLVDVKQEPLDEAPTATSVAVPLLVQPQSQSSQDEELEEDKPPPVFEDISTAEEPGEEQQHQEEDEDEEEEEVAPRKSGRVRKPKEFKDSVTPSYVKKSVERSKRTSKTDDVADEVTPPVEQKLITPETKPSRKRKLSGPPIKTEVLLHIKQEVISEPSQPEDSQTEDDVPTTKRKRTSTSKYTPTKRGQGRGGGGGGGDSSTADSASPKKKKNAAPIKLKIKPMAARAAVADETEDKTRTKKLKKKKSAGKLIVSFKKKSSDKKNVRRDSSAQEEDISPVKQEVASDVPGDEAPPPHPPPATVPKKTKSKKKSKNKKKLDSNNQKIVDVQTFDIADQSVVKVKKKKIYKKRHGDKVLVRIIKNHCNRSGEVVKIETVLVDSVPVKDEAGDDAAAAEEEVVVGAPPMLMDEVVGEGEDHDEDVDGDVGVDDVNDDEDAEDEGMVDDIKQEEDDEMEDEGEPPALVTTTTLSGRKKKKSKKDVEDKKMKMKAPIAVKKGGEVVKVVKRSRKSGKNVTIGGKVVGKTTKGLIKTGGKPKNTDLSALKRPCPCCTGRLLKVTEPGPSLRYSSEPKNAYNLFCRIYRPIIVANHPRADFSEISRRLAAIWKNATKEDRAGYFEVFSKMECAFRNKLARLGRQTPTCWSDVEFQYIKKAISHDLPFKIPMYSQTRLQPVDMAAHLQVLGDSLAAIGGALQKQSSMTVNGAMSLMLDSMVCALGPLICLTQFVPEMKALETEEMAKTMDNISYIMPGI